MSVPMVSGVQSPYQNSTVNKNSAGIQNKIPVNSQQNLQVNNQAGKPLNAVKTQENSPVQNSEQPVDRKVLNPTVQNYSLNKTIKDEFKKIPKNGEIEGEKEKKGGVTLGSAKFICLALAAVGVGVAIKKGKIPLPKFSNKAVTTVDDLEKHIEDLTKFSKKSTDDLPVKKIKIQFPIENFLQKTTQELEQAKADPKRIEEIRKSLNGVFEVMRRHVNDETKLPRVNIVLSERAKGREKEILSTFERIGRDTITSTEARNLGHKVSGSGAVGIDNSLIKEIESIDFAVTQNKGILAKFFEDKNPINVKISSYTYLDEQRVGQKIVQAGKWLLGINN